MSAQPASKAGSKKKLPFIIGGAAAGVIALVLIAIFVVAPAFNKNPFKGCQVGDVVEFGSYEQDGDTSNGKEPIEWRVLAVEDNRAFVVSEKALVARAFNSDSSKGNDWDSSELRAWLVGDFVSEAFSGAERRAIDGEPTLLSADEAGRYFKSRDDRVCLITQQAVNNGAWEPESDGSCSWWLRSPGDDSSEAGWVDSGGTLASDYVGFDGIGVRPALWVKL